MKMYSENTKIAKIPYRPIVNLLYAASNEELRKKVKI